MLRALLDRLRGRRTPRLSGAWARLSVEELARAGKIPGALAFTFPGTLEALHARLQAVGPWDWQIRESAWYGDYLVARGPGLGHGEGLRMRVYENEPEPGQFTIELIWYPESGPLEALEAAGQLVLQRILPGIGAENVRRTTTVD